MPFKTCPNCEKTWNDRDTFLSDPAVTLAGYQANFGNLEAGYFLFTHNVPGCGTSFAIQAGSFTDMHDGPIFEERKTGTNSCEGHCLHSSDLDPCKEKCECAYVRDVLQKIRNWKKAG